MSPLPERNPTAKEGVNASLDNPLKEFAWLMAAVLLIGFVAVTLIALAAKFYSPYIPFSLEQKVTQAINFNSANHPEQQKALEQLTASLLQAKPLPEDIQLQVHYSPEETVNAFATLGGHIMVYQGLIDNMGSENALAMVLAHEIAHVRFRHPIQGLSQGLVVQLLLSALTGNSYALQSVASSTGLMSMMSFSRDMEREADAYALEMLQQYYGHTQGAEAFFKQMQKQHKRPEWAAVLESHPHLGERIVAIKQSQKKQGELTALPKALQESPGKN